MQNRHEIAGASDGLYAWQRSPSSPPIPPRAPSPDSVLDFPPEADYNSDIFVSPDTQQWFNQKNGKMFRQEKGIEFYDNESITENNILKIIRKQEWDLYAKHPGEYVPLLVQEFYANMNTQTSTSWVRGKPINFSAYKINSLYRLRHEDDSATHMILNSPDMDTVVRKFCPYGADWTINTTGGKTMFQALNLSHEAKTFMHFASRRLHPNSNRNEVRADRATLIYAIITGMYLNVGRMINHFMRKERNSRNMKFFCFPSLITELMRDQGVEFPRDMYRNKNEGGILNQEFLEGLGETDGPRDPNRIQTEALNRPKRGRKTTTDHFKQLEKQMAMVIGNQAEILQNQNQLMQAQMDLVFRQGEMERNMAKTGNVQGQNFSPTLFPIGTTVGNTILTPFSGINQPQEVPLPQPNFPMQDIPGSGVQYCGAGLMGYHGMNNNVGYLQYPSDFAEPSTNFVSLSREDMKVLTGTKAGQSTIASFGQATFVADLPGDSQERNCGMGDQFNSMEGEGEN